MIYEINRNTFEAVIVTQGFSVQRFADGLLKGRYIDGRTQACWVAVHAVINEHNVLHTPPQSLLTPG